MENKKNINLFIWRVSYSHVIAYFIAGLFAVVIMGYQELFSSVALSFMHPVSSAIVSLDLLYKFLEACF